MNIKVEYEFELDREKPFIFFVNASDVICPFIQYTARFTEDGLHVTWIDPRFNEEDGMYWEEENAIKLIKDGSWIVLDSEETI